MIEYLKNPSLSIDFKVKQKTLKYILLSDELYKQSVEGLLLKCLDKSKSLKVMVKFYEGICNSHKLGPKIRYVIHKHGYYWLTMVVDYINYAQGV